MTELKISTQTRILEVAAVILTGLGKFVMVDFLQLKFWYIMVACLGWISYAAYRVYRSRGILNYWGFRSEGFAESLRLIAPASIAAVGIFVWVGLSKGTLIFNWHILPILLLYPVWGVIQQFLIIGLIARNLRDIDNRTIPTLVIILTASVVFAIVHFPVLWLVLATFVLALAYTFIYLRYRNLWILGLFHGWLGCFFYFFVLGRDPWLEFTASIR